MWCLRRPTWKKSIDRLQIAGHLLRRTAKKCPQRIEDTPAGVFCALLAVSERTGMSVVISSSEICVMHKSRR